MNNAWQEQITFTPDQLLIGTGWHEVEKDGDTYIRWTGPENISTIHLYPCRDQNNRLNMTINSSAGEEVLSKITLEADGVPLKLNLNQKRNPAYVTTILPADTSKKKDDPTIITLKLPKTLPANQVLSRDKDSRKLGIAISRIKIFPLSRLMFIAQKFSDPEPFDGINYIHLNPGVREAIIHGSYTSAYEYFLKHNRFRTEAEQAFELHEKFDECPGDFYDILRMEMQDQVRKLEKQFQEDIKILREIIFRQGNMIRELVNQNKKNFEGGS